MDETHRTLLEIAHSIRRRCRANGALVGLIDAACVAGLVGALVIVIAGVDAPLGTVVAGSVVAAGAVAFLSARRNTPTVIEALRRADGDIRARGLLPSAWEVLERERLGDAPRSAIAGALVGRAERALLRVETGRVVPLRLPPRTPFVALALALPILAAAASPYLPDRDATPALVSSDEPARRELIRPERDDTPGRERLSLAQRLRRPGGAIQRPEGGTGGDGGIGEMLRFDDAMRDLAPGDALAPGTEGGGASGEVASRGFLRAVPPDGTGGVVLLEPGRADARRVSPSREPGTGAPGEGERDESGGAGGLEAPGGRGSEGEDAPGDGADTTPSGPEGGGGAPWGGEREGSSERGGRRPGRGVERDSDEEATAPMRIEGVGTIALELPPAAENDVPVNELLSRARPWGTPGEETVPFDAVDFAQGAERILERQDIPESARVFVRDYFLRLDG